jgi:hypothetical protein
VEVLLAAALLLAFTLYERHQGAQSCVRADNAAVARDEQKAASDYAKGVTTVFQEASTYDAAIHAPVDRPIHVSVCQPSRGSTPAQDPTPAGVADAAPAVRTASEADPVQRDVGPELQAVGRDANAEVIGLQGYIREVCPVR